MNKSKPVIVFPQDGYCLVSLILTEQHFDLDLGALGLLLRYQVMIVDDDTPAEITITRANITTPGPLQSDALADALRESMIQHTDLVDLISAHEDGKRPPLPRHFGGYLSIDEFLDDPRREEVSR